MGVLEDGGMKSQLEELLENMELSKDKVESIKKSFRDSDMKEKIQDLVTAWLKFHQNHLPMYSTPGWA